MYKILKMRKKKEEHERMSKKETMIKKSKNQKSTKNKNLINNKGITLIALVITIIVLLILAGVTINLTLGENEIFRTAEMAGKNYTQAQEQELAGIANFENEINNIIAGTGTDTPELPENALKRIAKPGDYVRYIPAEKTFTKFSTSTCPVRSAKPDNTSSAVIFISS